MKKIFYVLGLFALVLTLGINSAKASIVSPPTFELEASGGDQLANTIKLKNDTAASETYYLSAEAFKASGEEGKPEFTTETDGIVSWISFAFSTITLQAGQTAAIPFTVNVPQFAKPGGYYAAVFATTTPPAVEGSGVGVSARIGSLVLVKVAGAVNESAKIAEFSTTKNSYSMLPVDFTTRVENNGGIHVKPYGEIIVRNMWGTEATRVRVNEAGGNVLPNSIRKFTSTWGVDSGATSFFQKYAQEKKEKAFGKYTAELTLGYGEGKILKSSVTFMVIPTERIIVDLIILIVIVLILIAVLRKYNEWLITNYNEKSKGKGSKPSMKM